MFGLKPFHTSVLLSYNFFVAETRVAGRDDVFKRGSENHVIAMPSVLLRFGI